MTIDVPGWIALVVTSFGLVSAVAAAVAVGRSAAAKASVDVLTTINEELRADNADLRLRLDGEQRARLTDKHDCEREIAEVRGQLKAMTSELGKSIGSEIGKSVGEVVIEMLRDEFGREAR